MLGSLKESFPAATPEQPAVAPLGPWGDSSCFPSLGTSAPSTGLLHPQGLTSVGIEGGLPPVPSEALTVWVSLVSVGVD